MTPATGGHARVGSPGVQAALLVLERLAAGRPLSLAELSREVAVAKSTLHRVCNVLVERGWAIRDDAGRYALGIRALGVGAAAAELPLVTAFRGVAAELLTRHDETVCLGVVDGEESVYLAIEETSQPIRLVTHVGSRTPAFASASGRVFLAARPPAEIAARYAGRPLVTPVGRRLTGVAELQTLLATTRERGYAENVEETAAGLWAASTPVSNGGGMVLAALTVVAPTSRMPPERRERVISDLRDAGAGLSASVAWLPSYDARRP